MIRSISSQHLLQNVLFDDICYSFWTGFDVLYVVFVYSPIQRATNEGSKLGSVYAHTTFACYLSLICIKIDLWAEKIFLQMISLEDSF